MYSVRPKQTVSMLTRDRIRLDADVYYPDADETFPVLLMRQPYGRAIASTVVYAHPTWYAAQGYIVVIQDVRGRGTSEGEFKLFEHEIEDGEDSVNWAATLPGSSGVVGMYGFSYQGMTQLYAAVNRPPALKALCPAMLAGDLYHDWAYENGAFCLFANLAWGIQIAAETARLKRDEAAFLRLSIAAKHLPLQDPDFMTEYDSFYLEWRDRSDPEDEYWRRLSPITYLENFDLPMLHIGGWFDTYMRGTWNFFKAMQRHSSPQHLIVGPWAHLPWGRKLGAIDYGPDASSDCDRAQIRWFDRFLKGTENQDPSIQLFEMGSNRWRNMEELPGFRNFFEFESTGLAGMNERDGRLVQRSSKSSIDVIVHDPWRPVPASGGHASYPCGSFDRSALDCRSDILTYTSDPLEQNLLLVGNITVELACVADTESFDLCAVLSEVKPNGSVFNFSQGYCRKKASPGERQLVRFDLQPTCMRIPQGSAIRLSVSAACFPAYPVNPGNQDQRAIAAQIMTIALYPQDSKILLPLLDPSE
jgi:uncharacterized protein